MTGYQCARYAEAIAEFGSVYRLVGCEGWLLERSIEEGQAVDFAGCYPVFTCGDWSRLGSDLEQLAGQAVTVSMVVDPFSGLEPEQLAQWFPDVCRPFKEHSVIDFSRDWRQTICRHHRRNVRAAAQRIEIEYCSNPPEWLETWIKLYDHLVARHDIRGIAKFSRTSFERQLRVPGIALFRAASADETVGMLWWYLCETVAWYHLGAFSSLGYELGAAFALFNAALDDFAARGVHWAALGSGAGWQSSADGGLTRFKQGWANDQKTAWFCGRILNGEVYRRLLLCRRNPITEYFPAYRRPEAA